MDPSTEGDIRQRRPARNVSVSREPDRRPAPTISPKRAAATPASGSGGGTGSGHKTSRCGDMLRSLFCLRLAKTPSGGSVLRISAGWPLALLLLVGTALYLVPVLICAPQPLFESGPAPPSVLQQLLTSPALSWSLPFLPASLAPPQATAETRARHAACTRLSGRGLPLPACSPVCATLYGGRRAVAAVGDAVYRLAATVGRKTGLDAVPDAMRAAIARTPPWPLFRIGEPIVDLLYTTLHTLIPPDKRLLMHTMTFMQTAVIRAVTKLNVADYIHSEYLSRQHAAIAAADAKTQARYRDRESEYHLPSSALGVSISSIAKATCSSESHLRRLLRAAQVIGIFEEIENDVWKQTPMSALLRADHPQSFRGAALMAGGEQYVAMSALHLTVRSGSPAFSEIYGDFWRYHDLAQSEWALYEAQPEVNGAPGRCTPFVPRGLEQAKQLSDAAYAHAGATDASNKAPMTIFPYQLTSHAPSAPATAAAATAAVPGASPVPVGVPRLNNVREPMMFASPDFNNGMTSIAATEAPLVAADAPFAGADAVVDVAGGRGHLLFEVLARHPGVATGVVFDLKRVYGDERTRGDMDARARKLLTQRLTAAPVPAAPSAAAAATAAAVAVATARAAHCHWDASPARAAAVAANLAPKGSVVTAYTPASLAPGFTAARTGAAVSAAPCPEVVFREGSFFEVDTVPRAHAAAAPALRRKVESVLRALHARGVDVTRPLTHAAASAGAEGDGWGTVGADGAVAVTHEAVYVLMQILHDWNDSESAIILANLRAAMTAAPAAGVAEAEVCCGVGATSVAQCGGSMELDLGGGGGDESSSDKGSKGSKIVRVPCPRVKAQYNSRLLVIDRLLQRGAHRNLINTQGANLADCLMMNNFNDAKERDEPTMAAVMARAGFTMTRVVPTRSMYVAFEGEPIVHKTA